MGEKIITDKYFYAISVEKNGKLVKENRMTDTSSIKNFPNCAIGPFIFWAEDGILFGIIDTSIYILAIHLPPVGSIILDKLKPILFGKDGKKIEYKLIN